MYWCCVMVFVFVLTSAPRYFWSCPMSMHCSTNDDVPTMRSSMGWGATFSPLLQVCDRVGAVIGCDERMGRGKRVCWVSAWMGSEVFYGLRGYVLAVTIGWLRGWSEWMGGVRGWVIAWIGRVERVGRMRSSMGWGAKFSPLLQIGLISGLSGWVGGLIGYIARVY